MILLVVLLTLMSFLETSFLGINWVLTILVIRSFLVTDKANLTLAFSFGILLSLLSNKPLGSLSLIYLILVLIVQLVKKFLPTASWLILLPVIIICLLVSCFIQSLVLKVSFSYQLVIIQALLALPFYILLKMWEERFVPQKDIKLKLRQ